MGASSNRRILTFRATAAIGAYLIVKAGADREHVAKATAVSDKIVGITNSEATKAEEMVEVALPGGGGKVKLGSGGCAFGDFLTADANGAAIVSSTANDNIVGVAQADGVEGDIVPVEIQLSNY